MPSCRIVLTLTDPSGIRRPDLFAAEVGRLAREWGFEPVIVVHDLTNAEPDDDDHHTPLEPLRADAYDHGGTRYIADSCTCCHPYDYRYSHHYDGTPCSRILRHA